jgi:uncharacterized protein YraI
MSCLGTAVISVVVLQNSMDILKGELGSCTETYATCTVDGNQVTGTEAERVSVIKKEEDQDARTIPIIKTEPKVSGVPVVSVSYISCKLYKELRECSTVCPYETKM